MATAPKCGIGEPMYAVATAESGITPEELESLGLRAKRTADVRGRRPVHALRKLPSCPRHRGHDESLHGLA